MDWWQYPQLILPQQIPAPEPTTVISFGLLVAILRLTSIPSFREPFLFGTSFQQKRQSYVCRCIQASSSVVPPFISIGVISLPGVCRLLSRSRSRIERDRSDSVLGPDFRKIIRRSYDRHKRS